LTHAYRNPRVADNIDGRFAITWVNGDNTSVPVVMAQVFAAAGTPITEQFIVPSYGDQTSDMPDIAMAPNGSFVIVWQGPDIDYGQNIQARMFSADGTPLGDQFRVNALAADDFSDPAIAMRDNGAFVVVWRQLYDGTAFPAICGQRFTAAGAKTGTTNFVVNYISGHSAGSPDVAINRSTGAFTAAWQQYDVGAGSGWDVFFQRFTASGSKTGSVVQMNTYTTNPQTDPQVAVDDSGNIAACWVSAHQWVSGKYGIVARTFNSSGTALCAEIQVNTASNNSLSASIACDRNGNFTVVWQAYDHPDDPITSDYGIIARQYNINGVVKTSQYVVNNPSLEHRGIDDQVTPAVSRNNGSGYWVAAWCGLRGIAPSGGISGVWHAQVAGNPAPSIVVTMTGPLSGSYVQGAIIPVSWSLLGAQAGTTINLFYSTGVNGTGTVEYISVGEITAANGAGTWNWDTSAHPIGGAQPGTYYIGAYYWNGAATFGYGSSSFRIT